MWQILEILAALVTLITATQPEAVRTFDEDRVDVPPAGFVASAAVPQGLGRWIVRRDHDNNVLAHIGPPNAPDRRTGRDRRGRAIALAIVDGPAVTNVSVTASVKYAGGDGRGGFVWRYQDAQNYYIVRLDLADNEQEVALYRVISGNWSRIGREEDLDLGPKEWHVLKVVNVNETIRIYLDGIKVVEVQDRTYRGPGAVGLWAAPEAVIYYDNLSLAEGERR